MSDNSPTESTPPRSKFTVVNTKKISSHSPSYNSDPNNSKKIQNEVSSSNDMVQEEPCSNTSASTTPVHTPPLHPKTDPVPLITPRYQKKSRTNRRMDMTNSTPEHNTPHAALKDQRTETLTITNGPHSYEQVMYFHTYDVYKHGKRKIHSRSVGYSSDGDLVVTREDISEPSDVDMGFNHKTTELSDPTVLDPRARRPLTDSEVNSKKKIRINRPRYKKYPGIHAPRNRKLRNRLHNDFFATAIGRELLESARRFHEENEDEEEIDLPPSFQDLPQEVLDTFDLEGEEQEKAMRRLGIAPEILNKGPSAATPPDPDSAEFRFHLLNTRLRGELQHAFASDFLSAEIEDLEANFVQFLKDGPTEESLCFYFRDGYGRLVCHGVATYYRLVSESRMSADGTHKYTYVSYPKSKRTGIKPIHLPQTPLIKVLRGKSRHLPSRHTLSAGNTPMQAAQDAPVSEPMTPLDLGAANDDGFPSSSLNPTVYRTVQGKLKEAETLDVYVPQLTLSLEDFEEKEEEPVQQE